MKAVQIAAALATATVAGGLALAACGGTAANWSANGKEYAVADYQAGDTARLVGVTPQTWCQDTLVKFAGKSAGNAGVALKAPSLPTGSQAAQWISGCVAGYYVNQPGPAPPTATPVVPSQTPTPAPAPAPARTVIVTVPAAPAQQQDAWALVSEYYGDVTSGDYTDAWALLKPGVTGQTYAQFVAGYNGTGAQDVTETGETGGTVTYILMSVNPDGTVQTYDCSATTAGGLIASFSATQTSGAPGA